MQLDSKQYNPDKHDKYSGLSVKQPYADLLTKPVYRDEDGGYHAEKTIEVRSRNTKYRGDVLVCSSKKPLIPGRMSGVTCGLVELYDVKSVEDFTAEDWEATCIPVQDRPKKGYGWLMRNPRRVVEMPVSGQLGFYTIVVPKDDITQYPRNLVVDRESWELIKKQIK